MKLWIDAQLLPSLGPWMSKQFDIEAVAVLAHLDAGEILIELQNVV